LPDDIAGQIRQPLEPAFGISALDNEISAIDPAGIAKAQQQRLFPTLCVRGREW
jgi:hypothetical protein